MFRPKQIQVNDLKLQSAHEADRLSAATAAAAAAYKGYTTCGAWESAGKKREKRGLVGEK
jgi:hypothetical protein